MSFTMEQYNEALLSVIDKNKRYAIEALQKPTTVYKTEGFKNILYTLMVAPQLQDSQSVLDFSKSGYTRKQPCRNHQQPYRRNQSQNER